MPGYLPQDWCWMWSGKMERRSQSFLAWAVSLVLVVAESRFAWAQASYVAPRLNNSAEAGGATGPRFAHSWIVRVSFRDGANPESLCSWSVCVPARTMHLQWELLTRCGCSLFHLFGCVAFVVLTKRKKSDNRRNKKHARRLPASNRNPHAQDTLNRFGRACDVGPVVCIVSCRCFSAAGGWVCAVISVGRENR